MIRAILTDIEGTTTAASFVDDILLPYARRHLAAYVRANEADPAVRVQLQAVGAAAGRPLADEQALQLLLGWMDEGNTVPALRALQGMVWEAGYRQRDFTGHVYQDAAQRFGEWQRQGCRLYVYSSQSEQAQRLLFGHSDWGDLTPLFSGFFDTRIGPKREPDSYLAIATRIGYPAGEVLFLSGVGDELDAAGTAGMRTCRLVRDGQPDPRAAHPQVGDFASIDPGGYS